MKSITATKETLKLYKALKEQGIKSILEYWDGYKHIDICIPEVKIYIEVDGLHHFTDPKQIQSDFKRNHYSDDDNFDTIHIPNIVLEKCLNNVVKAIVAVVKKRSSNTDNRR